MAIAQEIIGTHYRFDDYFVVGREKVREYANALQDEHPFHHDEAAAAEAGYSSLVASLTFIAVAGRRVQLEMFKNFDVGINLERVIHRDQKLKFHRPIVVGDKLFFDTYLDSVIQSHGAVIAEVRSEVTDEEGKPVLTTVVSMLGEAISDEHTDAQVAAIASRIGGA
jgi:acyl dehydratase